MDKCLKRWSKAVESTIIVSKKKYSKLFLQLEGTLKGFSTKPKRSKTRLRHCTSISEKKNLSLRDINVICSSVSLSGRKANIFLRFTHIFPRFPYSSLPIHLGMESREETWTRIGTDFFQKHLILRGRKGVSAAFSWDIFACEIGINSTYNTDTDASTIFGYFVSFHRHYFKNECYLLWKWHW